MSYFASKLNKNLVANHNKITFFSFNNSTNLLDYLTKKHTPLAPKAQPRVRITLKS